MVVSSFALQNLTKTRYDYQSSKTSTLTMEEGLGMNKDRKRVDIREEYFVSLPNECRASVTGEAGEAGEAGEGREGRERGEKWLEYTGTYRKLGRESYTYSDGT
jgi:hypothetical protein